MANVLTQWADLARRAVEALERIAEALKSAEDRKEVPSARR
jgi:hypothetical protein